MADPQNIKGNISRMKLIEAGKSLFYRYGYRKVTVEEICKEAGVSKMTFYRFFDNKIDLVRMILSGIAEEGMREYREIMARDISFEEKIRETIRMKRDSANQFSEEFLRDIYQDPDNDLMPALQKMTSESMSVFMEDYRIAQEEGQIRNDLNINFIPYFLNQMNVMVNDPALLAMYGDIHVLMTELTNLFFYGILQNRNFRGNEN